MTGPHAPLIVNGWSIYAHPLFLDQLHELIEEVESKKGKDPEGYKRKNCSKRLAAILKIITENIPADPSSESFQLGKALGAENAHWRRAKFFQQYRLFFRFDSKSRLIVLAWVNDDETLRAYESKSDAYSTFRRMLERGKPPDDFGALMKEAIDAKGRFGQELQGIRSE